MKQFAVACLFLVTAVTVSHAQALSLSPSFAASAYYYVERSNWSRYDNGAYVGLTHRETRANVSSRGTDASGARFAGFFYVLEETLKDMSKSAQGVDEMYTADFTVSTGGHMSFARDSGFPRYRDFPVLPSAPVVPGDRWQAESSISIDPKNDGKRSVLPIVVEYTFVGQDTWNGEAAYRIRAKYATRLNKYLRPSVIDPSLASANGTHDAEILVSEDTGAVLLILDRLDETFAYADGSTIRFKGNTAIFTEYPAIGDRARLTSDIVAASETFVAPDKDTRKAVEDSFATSPERVTPEPNTCPSKPAPASAAASAPASAPATEPLATDGGKPFAVEETEQGVRLSVRDLRFEPDSDAILAGETWRLDAIAQTLRLADGGYFLVEGHTASVGKPSGEKDLSVKRAKKIVDELARRGIPAERFIYSGYGGTKPIADNATAAGRALNRRVEITIMR